MRRRRILLRSSKAVGKSREGRGAAWCEYLAGVAAEARDAIGTFAVCLARLGGGSHTFEAGLAQRVGDCPRAAVHDDCRPDARKAARQHAASASVGPSAPLHPSREARCRMEKRVVARARSHAVMETWRGWVRLPA